jgi:hypothetical protein
VRKTWFDDEGFCGNCQHRSGGPTLDFDQDGNRVFSNGCGAGYDIVSCSEACKRPAACIRHNERQMIKELRDG